jgi:hypothetical protein
MAAFWDLLLYVVKCLVAMFLRHYHPSVCQVIHNGMVSYPKRLKFSTTAHLARLLLFQQIRGTLNKQADILESLHRNVVRQMEGQVRSLEKLTKRLEENLKFNHSSLNESIRLILLEVAAAQDYLNMTASKEIKNVCGHSQY